MRGLLIHNANQVVTPQGLYARGKDMNTPVIYKNASIYIENHVIRAVGSMKEVSKVISETPQILDATGKVVIPGLVDSHTHLVFAGLRDDEFRMRAQGFTYSQLAQCGGGIFSTVNKTRSASKAELKSIAKTFLLLALQHGTTTMEIKSGYGLSTEQELKILEVISELNEEQPITLIPTFLGAHAVPPEKTKDEYLIELMAMIPNLKGKTRFIDVFIEENYFSNEDAIQLCNEARRYEILPRLHVNQFSSMGGVSTGLELGAVSLDHLEVLTEEEIALISASSTVATLLPCSSLFLGKAFAPMRTLIDQGAIVALASNFNPGSAMNVNMQLVMSVACMQMKCTPDEALTAATLNGAYSLGLASSIGTIEEGKKADLLILDVECMSQAIYFFGVNHTNVVIKKGEVVWQR